MIWETLTRNSEKISAIVTLELRPARQLLWQEFYRILHKYTWNGKFIISSNFFKLLVKKKGELKKIWLSLRLHFNKWKGINYNITQLQMVENWFRKNCALHFSICKSTQRNFTYRVFIECINRLVSVRITVTQRKQQSATWTSVLNQIQTRHKRIFF